MFSLVELNSDLFLFNVFFYQWLIVWHLIRIHRQDTCNMLTWIQRKERQRQSVDYFQQSSHACRPACRHFSEGRCTYGDECRFSHQGLPFFWLVWWWREAQRLVGLFHGLLFFCKKETGKAHSKACDKKFLFDQTALFYPLYPSRQLTVVASPSSWLGRGPFGALRGFKKQRRMENESRTSSHAASFGWKAPRPLGTCCCW